MFMHFGVMDFNRRGQRLYDPEVAASKALVQKWTSFYRTYRQIVTSDIIHVRAPDGQSVDCMLHVNPRLPQHKGLALLINPTGMCTLTSTLTCTSGESSLHSRWT
jgi:hypothetical protein